MRLPVAPCALLALTLGTGCEQVLGIEDLEPTAPPTNGSLWALPESAEGYDSLDVRVRPMSDPANVPYGLLNALQFELAGPADGTFLLDSGGYIGLHSDPRGKRVEFVIWGARAAVGPWAEQACDGTVLPCADTFDDNDGFKGGQAIISYDWRANRSYTLQVERVIQDPAGDWWEAIVTDVDSAQRTRIGRIQAQPTWQGLTQAATTWFEIYGEHGTECEGSPDPMATFRAPRANYGQVTAEWVMNLAALCRLPPRSLD
ncbi:MAG TPA: hypothetical protein VI072_07140 [Polyangiaceae bacterium]